MNAALDQHNALLRRLIDAHGGYESRTEGDSFVAAFHTPHSALAFALAAQAQLLTLPWPSALLKVCRWGCACAGVWVRVCVRSVGVNVRGVSAGLSGVWGCTFGVWLATQAQRLTVGAAQGAQG
eukprot:37288-Chlamydomonas_euryale.AAC.1